MSETRERTLQFLANLGVADTSLPLDLSSTSLSPSEIVNLFGEGEWNILGLNIIVLPEEKKTLILPNNITSSLVTLKINGNQHLANVDVIAECGNLHTLYLDSVNEVKSYAFIHNLTNLRNLHITNAAGLSIEDMKVLLPEITTLNLTASGIEGKLELNMPKLRSLTLNETKISSLIFSRNMPNLQHLKIKKCEEIVTLNGLNSCPHLRSLDATDCLTLNNINALTQCTELVSLKVKGCGYLNDVQALHNTLLLRHLAMNCVDTMINMPSLRHFPDLHTLNIGKCSNVNFIAGVTKLRVLKLDNMESIEGLPKLPQVRRLHLNNILLIISLAKLQDIPNLRKLVLINCPRLITLDGLSVCAKLTELKISSCTELETLSGTEGCFILEDLIVINCNIRDLSGPVHCNNMYISNCTSLVTLNLNERCVQLLSLIIENAPLLVDLYSLEQCISLIVLHLTDCFGLVVVPFLDQTKLGELAIQNCPKLSTISPAPMLEIVEIMGSAISKVNFINENNRLLYLHTDCSFDASLLTKATKLDLVNQDFKNVLPLVNCTSVRELRLSKCNNLTSLKGIPSSCVNVEIIECSALTRLQGINACKELKYLSVQSCPSLSDVSDAAKLSMLYTLFVDNCDLLQGESALSGLQEQISSWQREGTDFLRLD